MSAWRALGMLGLAGLVGCSGALETEEPPAAPAKDDVVEKIVGGRAEAGFPAVGALLTPGGSVCTATVIAPRWILSAAHCFDDGDFGYTFSTGPDMDRPQRRVGLSAIWRHPQWNSRALVHDIALAQLSGDPGVAPMGLADDVRVGDTLLFVGYGLTDGRGWELGQKRSVEMPVTRLDATTFTYAVRGRNTCGGDSGGPAFRWVGGQMRVAGVTSYGDQNCQQYGVDTRVDAYLGWIEQVVGPLQPAAPAEPPAEPPADRPADGVGDPQPAPPLFDPCGGLDYLGECQGSVARWCDGDEIRSRECGREGCGYVDDRIGYYCGGAAAAAPPADPCAGLDYLGRCDGPVAEWCDGGVFEAVDCGQYGAACAYVDDSVGFYCVR
jgi:V8-like Glu-specific endopeptidase